MSAETPARTQRLYVLGLVADVCVRSRGLLNYVHTAATNEAETLEERIYAAM